MMHLTIPSAETGPANSHVTRLAFRNRFTAAEKVAIELAALDDPAAGPEARAASAGLRTMLRDLDAATFVDLARPDTRAGVQALETLTILAPGRAGEVLDAPIADAERPL